ncbi:hypothetical protein HK102_002135, partial [Quaeritorhiza haematococci]
MTLSVLTDPHTWTDLKQKLSTLIEQTPALKELTHYQHHRQHQQQHAKSHRDRDDDDTDVESDHDEETLESEALSLLDRLERVRLGLKARKGEKGEKDLKGEKHAYAISAPFPKVPVVVGDAPITLKLASI